MKPVSSKTGGLASWSINRPVAVSAISIALVVVGLVFLGKLTINLLPDIIYPEIRVRILEPGVPATIMEDRITRQLEEQLAITEGAISTQSTTTEGRSALSLSFSYDTDIDTALRDASTRLDRAKRFLPDTINPPVIYKRDPSQIPVMEFAISSSQRNSQQLRDWVDYEFSKWFLNLPGVASLETGGGTLREIQVIPDQSKLVHYDITIQQLIDTLKNSNIDIPSGRTLISDHEYSTQLKGRFSSIDDIRNLQISHKNGKNIFVKDIANVLDTHSDERLKIRLNNQRGIKLSIQKQPEANSIDVVNHVKERLQWLKNNNTIPDDITYTTVSDQSIFVRHALNNASGATISGALLAMIVVFVFLGDLRRTLIIGTAIPLAIFITFILMGGFDLTLNIMSLGGLALGVGMLVDNTIVMLENISRHQKEDGINSETAIDATREVTSALIASTTTSLVAILPFIFIGGLIGLLFTDLIFTISSSILASLLVALTLVPALGARSKNYQTHKLTIKTEQLLEIIKVKYLSVLSKAQKNKKLVFAILLPALLVSILYLSSGQDTFLPKVDEGKININIVSDSGTNIDNMDETVKKIEKLIQKHDDVLSVFSTVGGSVFGRSSYESSNRASIDVQLKNDRSITSQEWLNQTSKEVKKLNLVGYRVRFRIRGIRGIRLSQGDDDVSIRVQGDDLETLREIGEQIVATLQDVKGLRNLAHSYEEAQEQILFKINRARLNDYGVSVTDVGKLLAIAMEGTVISDYIDNDRQYDIRLRLPAHTHDSIDQIKNLVLINQQNQAFRLHEVVDIKKSVSPSKIQRDNQRRIVEVSASISDGFSQNDVMEQISKQLTSLKLPDGYYLYDGGISKTLQQGQKMGYLLLALALFLIYVVLAVQYESLRNPLIIILGVPFCSIGVVAGLYIFNTPISMPVWLGFIMLTGLVVNHAIILVEQIEVERSYGASIEQAINSAASHRLRPILMTTLTTVFGMLPLAIGFGEGSEMLQPLAIVIVSGLFVSMLVSLVIIPLLYQLLNRDTNRI